MIELEKYRIVDLSRPLYPGKEKRRLSIRQFRYGFGEIMHEIDTMSHIGTHVEVPSHYVNARYGRQGADLSEVPIEKFLGEAVLVDLSSKGPHEPITVEDLENANIKEKDIVLIGNSPYRGDSRPYLSAEAAKWLAKKKVKMVGFDDTVMVEEPTVKNLEDMATHDSLLSNGILIIEMLTNLDKLRTKRFFFIGLPVNIAGLDAFPIRAIALEPKEVRST